MNVKKLVAVIETVLFVAITGVCLYFFFEQLRFELIGAFCGYVIGFLCTGVVAKFLDIYNDKTKLLNASFNYDADLYLKKVRIGEHCANIWYYPDTAGLDVKYSVRDDGNKHFNLEPLIQINFTSIIKAHRNSFTDNPMMVRLDDYIKTEEGVTLVTSRTAYFNDLATNRSMDYEFSDGLTIRTIYESNRLITPLGDSKMSNHIGINTLIFQGEDMILAHRGRHGTTAKNICTSGLAVGLSENDWLAAKKKVESDDGNKLFDAVILLKLAKEYGLDIGVAEKAYAEKRIRIYHLGMGRVLFMGGKPQFYFAVVVDKDFALLNQKINANKNQIDYNKSHLVVNSLELLQDGREKMKMVCRDGKTKKISAETSFFINYWTLLKADRLPDVPSWVYDNAAAE